MSTSSGAPIQRTGTLLSLAEARIDLVDNAPSSLAATYDGGYDEDGTLQLVSTGAGLRQPRSNPIRHQLLKRKYAKHSEAKYKGSLDVARTNIDRLAVDTERSDREGSSTNLIEREASEAALTKAGKIKRGQKKVKGLIKNRRNKNNPANDGDSAVDVLYENQRGSFVFGMPLFSSQSLLNFDPAPWVNAYGHSSSVNITNAQLPNLSWQWVWHTWYVDMSQDVDEQGWQYSFMFQDKFSWHGTHPWLHSFVRRRRWLRKRVRSVHKSECRETYRLNASYFQVGEGRSSVLQGEQVDAMKPDRARDEDMTDILVDDIDDLPTLLHSLKTATVDREKITMVLAYMDKASADTHNFAEEVRLEVPLRRLSQTSNITTADTTHSLPLHLSKHTTPTPRPHDL